MGSEFLAALFGAVAGGFASALGSMFVARRHLKKTMRLRIYDELLPPIRLERVYYDLRRIPAGDDEKPVDPPNPTVEFMERMWA
jgi:hypothetical protein